MTRPGLLAPPTDEELRQLAGKFWRGFNLLCDVAEKALADMEQYPPASLEHRHLFALSRTAMGAMREIRDLHEMACQEIDQRGQEG